MRLPALLAAIGSLVVGPGLAFAGGHGAGGHGGGGHGGGHVSPPRVAQPRISMPRAPHVNMPRRPEVSRGGNPQFAYQPRSYSGNHSHPITHQASQTKNSTPVHVTQPGVAVKPSGHSVVPAGQTSTPAKTEASAVASSSGTKAATATTPTSVLSPRSPGLAGTTTPGGNTPIALANPRPATGTSGATASTVPGPVTTPTTPVTTTTPTTPVTPTTPTIPGSTPINTLLVGGIGNPYGLGYGLGYGTGYGRGYGGRRGYGGYGGYGRGYGGYGNGNNSYYFAHMRAIARLANDLNGLSRGMTIATGRANRIRSDLMRVVYGGNSPPPAMVQQLSMDLTRILPTRTSPMMNTGQLARDLAVVMNGGREYSMQVQSAIGRAHSALRHAGVPNQGVQTLISDMMGVASVGNMMNNAMAGGIF